MRREVFREVGGAVDEARSAPSQERPAEVVHARLIDNTAVVAEASGAMKNRQVDPRQVGPEAGGPHDRAHLATRAIVLRITETPHCRSPKFPRQLSGVEGLI